MSAVLSNDFRRLLQAQGKARSTIIHYTGAADRFLKWRLNRVPESERGQITELQARDFLIDLANSNGMSSTTYNIAFNGIRHFLRMVLQKDLVDLGGLRPQRCQAPGRQVLSPESVIKILAQVPNQRYRVLLTVMYALGLRLQEACHLAVPHIERGTGMLLITHAKGGKNRRIKVSPSVLELLRKYYRQWKPKTLFFTKDGNPNSPMVCPQTIQAAFIEAKRMAGILTPGSTHLLRHSFAVHQLANGCDIRNLQVALGHANLNTTIIYLGDLDQITGDRPPVVDLIETWPEVQSAQSEVVR